MNVIPLRVYCELEGVEAEAIRKRIQKGLWRQGKEVLLINGLRGYYIDVDAVERWMRDPKNHAK
ncbi:hypothetical protein [Vibrio jasicida]|uniref:hypothetical protein n=1 Tax=Vibrio jasicida TaxID=766224 RepID=UPI0005EF122A|nr:hypothetical protein [Vibrio jasicida]